jgi:hypothetical protein
MFFWHFPLKQLAKLIAVLTCLTALQIFPFKIAPKLHLIGLFIT